jgi:hypothetical protein
MGMLGKREKVPPFKGTLMLVKSISKVPPNVATNFLDKNIPYTSGTSTTTMSIWITLSGYRARWAFTFSTTP